MSRTVVGRDFVSDAMFAATRPNPATVIALSESTAVVPGAGANNHTVLTGTAGNELAADGFARALAVYAHTAGAQTSTLQKTFTHSAAAGAGTPRTIRIVGVFSPGTAGTPGAADSGILVFEMPEPNPPTLTGTDSLNQTVSIDFGA